jgi:hypothetical protein
MAISSALRKKISDQYPAFDYLLDIPEVANLLAKASQEGWDTTRLQSQLYATRWWKTHSETARNWDTVVATDPADAKRQRAIRIDEVANEVRRLGIKMKQWDIIGIAEGSLRGGWDPSRITQRIVAVGRGHGLEAAGDVRATMQDLRALGKQYAVNLSNPTLENWAFAMATGRLTEDGIRANIVNIAKDRIDPKGENKVLRAALDQGLTVRDAYAGVIETVAGELEMDPSRVDLTNQTYGELLDFVDQNGIQRPQTQTEAIQWARKRGAWQQTGKAKETYSGLANALTAKMGLRK